MGVIKAIFMLAVLTCGIVAVQKAHAQTDDRLQRQAATRKQFDELLPCAAFFRIEYLCIPESMRDDKLARETKIDEFGSRLLLQWLGDKAGLSLESQLRMLEEERARMFATVDNSCRGQMKLWFTHESKCSKLALDFGQKILSEFKADLPAETRSKARAKTKKRRTGIRAE